MAGPTLPLDKAYLTAIWLETLFYGMNLLLFASYLFIFRYKRKTPLNKVILWTAIAMFCFSTAHVSLGFYRLIEGFIYLRNQPGGPATFLSDISTPANVAKIIVYTINSILGDGILVWRCYHVWGGSWKICVVPIIMITASTVCGIGQAISFAQARTTHSAFGASIAGWNTSLFCLALATNVIVTCLIAFRIWYLTRRIDSLFSSATHKYRRVLALVVESGAIYSFALIFEILFYAIDSNVFYIVYDPIAQLMAIVPTMIIVMTSLGFSSDAPNSQNGGTMSSLKFIPAGKSSTSGGSQSTL